MEWGCMQALIDFDGWRKWKDFSQQTQASAPGKATNNHAHKGSVAGAKGGAGGANSGAKSGLALRRDKRLSASTTGTGTTSDSSRSEVVDGDREGGRGTPIVAEA